MIVGICVGNGLSIDLQKSYPSNLEMYDTYNFLSWDIQTPNEECVFLTKLPRLKKHIELNADVENDFKLVERLLDSYKRNPLNFENSILLCEVQHFIAIAFSKYQLQVDKIDLGNWKWVKWLKENRETLCFAISFNYDLVFERALSYSEIPYRRVGVQNEYQGMWILKPHGSIDFEIDPRSISMPPITYPLVNAVHNNNCGIYALETENLLLPRREVDIVLPNEYSTQLEYQWIKPGYDALSREGHMFTHFIFAGLSYSVFDRDEVDYIIECLKSDTAIIIANPDPNKQFLEKVNSRFDRVEIWKNGPKSLY